MPGSEHTLVTSHYDGTPCTLVECVGCGDREYCQCDASTCESCGRTFGNGCCDAGGDDPDGNGWFCWKCGNQFLRDIVAGRIEPSDSWSVEQAKAALERDGSDRDA